MHFNALKFNSSLRKPYIDPGDLDSYLSELIISDLNLSYNLFLTIFYVITNSGKNLPKPREMTRAVFDIQYTPSKIYFKEYSICKIY